MIRSILQVLKREDGVTALMTLVFMMFAGLVAMTTLWTIGYASATYNSLYQTTQNAARAAASYTSSVESGQYQLKINCNTTDSTSDCTSGPAFESVLDVLSINYQPGDAGRSFGMRFDRTSNLGTVQLVDVTGNPRMAISAYNVTNPPMVSYQRAVAISRELSGGTSLVDALCSAQNGLVVQRPASGTGGAEVGQRICWGVSEYVGQRDFSGGSSRVRVIFPAQVVSGVIVRTRASVRVPVCGSACPTFNATAVGAASVSQPQPRAGY